MGSWGRPRLSVGQLANRAGVSVRTLHHNDEIGLLSPSLRTDAGHRLYAEDDVARLLGIRSLQALGFLLRRARSELEDRQRLVSRPEGVARVPGDRGEAGLEDLLQALEDVAMFER